MTVASSSLYMYELLVKAAATSSERLLFRASECTAFP